MTSSMPPQKRTGILLPYQKKFLEIPRYYQNAKGHTRAGTKAFIKSRRIGGTYVAAVECLCIATGRDFSAGWNAKLQKPADVWVVGANHSGSKEFLNECRDICNIAAPFHPEFALQNKNAKECLEFVHSGKRITALPTGQNVRGKTGAVVWDECAFAEHQEWAWNALGAIAKPNIREERGYPTLLISTPWLEGSAVHRLMTEPRPGLTTFQIDVYEAHAQGHPLDPEDARHDAVFEETFQVEYCCQWVSGGSSFFSLELLNQARREELPPQVASSPSYWGIDIGRVHDLTAAVEIKKEGDTSWIVSVQSFRGMRFDDQIEKLSELLTAHDFVAAHVDKGGMGMPIAEALTKRFGSKVRGIDLTQPSKEMMAIEARKLLEEGKLRFWSGDTRQTTELRALLLELSKIKGTPTAGGKMSFTSDRDAQGHGDRAWAMLMGLPATKRSVIKTPLLRLSYDYENTPIG